MTEQHFHNPVAVTFGRDCRTALRSTLAERRCLIVTSARGRAQLLTDPVLGELAPGADHRWVDDVTSNPEIAWLDKRLRALRDAAFDTVIGFGGGSSLDSAKVFAVALAADRKNKELAEVLAAPPERRTLQLVAVPTTAGTGSEVTPSATVWDSSARAKSSLHGPAVFPDLAVVDPALTDRAPAEVSRNTGLDAVNQALESLWNRNATAVSEAFASRALDIGLNALIRVVEEGSDREAREHMSECSLLAGLAISQTRTALCHAISYPLTMHFGIPHGLACAFTMPAVLRHNAAADDGRLARATAAVLGPGARVAELAERCDALNDALGVRRAVRAAIPSLEALLALRGAMYQPGRADNNLAEVTDERLDTVLREAWGE